MALLETHPDRTVVLKLDETEAVCLAIAISHIQPNTDALFFQKINKIREALKPLKIPQGFGIATVVQSITGEIKSTVPEYPQKIPKEKLTSKKTSAS